MDLDSFLVSLYVQIDDWWKLNRALWSHRKPVGLPCSVIRRF
jgi:hypothetical protein